MTLRLSVFVRVVVLSLLPLAASWSAEVVEQTTAAYPEGPLWFHGRLLYVEYGGRGVKSWDGKQATDFWGQDHCGPSGLIEFGANHLLVACYDANSIVELDDRGREIRTINRDRAGRPFVGPNDFASDRTGGIYFSASGVYELKAPITGAVLHISADGKSVVEVANTIHYSNGLTLSQDGKSLLVAEMLAARILEFPINGDGSLGPRTVWARLADIVPLTGNEDGYNGPDGFKLGPDGNYYIAQNGSGRVLVVNAQKHLVRSIRIPTPYVTNVNFGPDGTDTLYITGAFDQWKAPYPGAVYRWHN